MSRCVDLVKGTQWIHLVGGWATNPSEKIESLGIGWDDVTIPNCFWKVIGKSYSKPPTRSNELVMSYKFRGKHLHFFEWFQVHSWIFWSEMHHPSMEIFDTWVFLYMFLLPQKTHFFKSGWCHCFGFGIFLMSSIFPFLMVCIFGLHHEPIPSFGDIFRQSNSQILNYGIVM